MFTSLMEHLSNYEDNVENHLPDFGDNDINKNNTDNHNVDVNEMKFKDVRIHDESDASIMLLYLLQQHDLNPNYIVIPQLEELSNKLTGLF
ncbi:1709_t:CDS:2 [Cetraspora pellucida]|uniref:1709_t:CDS:1 n=1 Tax=Cetraspora pellucida TaxID=1433469 RepID=A0A9N9I1Q8_9GLOM|nr:1709_t:CDS:2 [Cetraspora pellucida]